MTRDEVVAKARDLMTPVLGVQICANLVERVLRLESLKDIRDLRPLLYRPDRAKRSAATPYFAANTQG
jgi:hypothetical protein